MFVLSQLGSICVPEDMAFRGTCFIFTDEVYLQVFIEHLQ